MFVKKCILMYDWCIICSINGLGSNCMFEIDQFLTA